MPNCVHSRRLLNTLRFRTIPSFSVTIDDDISEWMKWYEEIHVVAGIEQMSVYHNKMLEVDKGFVTLPPNVTRWWHIRKCLLGNGIQGVLLIVTEIYL